MSVHTLPNATPVKVPNAETIAGMQERIYSRPDCMAARDCAFRGT